MVIRVEHTGLATNPIPMQHLGWLGQRGMHTREDALQEVRIVHGRTTKRALVASLHPRNELSELDSIKIDEPLLTGNLEQDISILNIVA